MKRLFLSSSFKDVAGLFEDFAGAGLKGRSVAFIPTAALHEKINFYVKAGRKALEKLGLRVVELEISTAAPAEIEEKLGGTDLIYVSGGNTFFLLQELKKSGADKRIRAQVDKGENLYRGIRRVHHRSAGYRIRKGYGRPEGRTRTGRFQGAAAG